MSQPEVRIATPDDRDRVVGTVVAAFAADPAFRFFFADEDAFDDQAATFTGYLFDKRVHQGSVWVVDGGASVAMWDPPAQGDLAAAVPPACELPVGVMARLDEYDAVVHQALPARPHWYLGVVATHPDHQGKQWGRAAMAAGIARAVADGVPALLETTKPDNVEMYGRSGWTVTARGRAQDLQVWVMTHTGGASADQTPPGSEP